VIHHSRNADNCGLVDYVSLGFIARTEGELNVSIPVEYVCGVGAQENQILICGMKMLYSVKVIGLNKNLETSVEVGAGNLTSTAEISLGMHDIILRVAFKYKLVVFHREGKNELTKVAICFFFFGEDISDGDIRLLNVK
jgi:hypothetical protein